MEDEVIIYIIYCSLTLVKTSAKHENDRRHILYDLICRSNPVQYMKV